MKTEFEQIDERLKVIDERMLTLAELIIANEKQIKLILKKL